jgi:hypothetical protein
MFSISLRQADHVRHYSISAADSSGWVVKLEQDREPAKVEHFDDWHRVERALAAVKLEVARLTARGWQIQSTKR